MKNNRKIQYLKEHGGIIFLIVLFSVFGMYYVSRSARNIVFMDYWTFIEKMIPAATKGGFNLKLFWTPLAGHRNFLLQYLLYFDIKYLSLNCVWEAYGGIVALACTSIVVYLNWNKLYKDINNKSSKIFKYILFIPILFGIYNLNQWEILSLQYSFTFMLRITLFLLIFYLIDKEIISKFISLKNSFLIGVLCFFTICLLSQLYFPAMLASIAIVIIVSLIIDRNDLKRKIPVIFVFVVPCLLASCFYFWNLSSGVMGSGLKQIFEIVFNGQFVLGILYMLVATVFPQTITEKFSVESFIFFGIVLVTILFLSIILFIKDRIYKITFFPILCILYGTISIPVIIYGRVEKFDLIYLTSSRYTCETTLIWVGCLIILGYSFVKNKMIIIKALSIISIVILTGFLWQTDQVENNISIYRGAYKDNLIQIIKNNDQSEIDDDTLRGLQDDPEVIRKGIQLMKKYNLNIYAPN